MENPLFIKLFTHDYDLEDFTTEVFAGVLRSQPELLDRFVNQILGIEGRQFVLETQKNYSDVTIDMVFSNEETLCFLENKVQEWAEEQSRFLEKCEAVLLTERQEHSNIYLRYCSKYYDTQPIQGINFAQFRWAEVYTFLESYSENPLVKAFLEFIEDRNMKGVMKLNADDLITISHFNETIKKMDECLDSIAAEFTLLFGYPSRGAPKKTLERLELLLQLNSYRMMKQDILFGGGGWSEMTVCFDYEKLTNTATTLAIWYWCDKTHEKYEKFKELFKKNKSIFSNDPGFFYEERSVGFRVMIQKPLTDFDTEKNQLKAIHDWLVEILGVFKKFADKTPQLEWNIPH